MNFQVVGSLHFEKKEQHCTSKTTKPTTVCKKVGDLMRKYESKTDDDLKRNFLSTTI